MLSIVMYVGSFDQFDGIMYPEEQVKTFWNSVRGLLVGGSSMPEHDFVQQKSLRVHLRCHRKMLLTCSVANLSSFSSILHIFYQLHSPKVHYNNRRYVWPGHGVSEVCINKVVQL